MGPRHKAWDDGVRASLSWGCAGLAAAFALAACSPDKPPSSQKDAAASSQPADLSWYLQPAFKAAFGVDAPAPHAVDRRGQPMVMQYSPHLLADLGDGRMALISTGAPPDGCQGCGGAVSVHYLKRSDDGFHVVGQWYDLGPLGPTGDAPVTRIRGDLFARPALQIEVSDRNQGCETAAASLFELGPNGPVPRARDIVTARSNIAMGALRAGPMVDDFGNILPDVKGEHFRVQYRGTLPGEVTYAPAAHAAGAPEGVWAPQGDFKLPDC
jgi:hypothetical protein